MPKENNNLEDTIWSNASRLADNTDMRGVRSSGRYVVENPVNGPSGSGHYLVETVNAVTDVGVSFCLQIYYSALGVVEYRTYSTVTREWSDVAVVGGGGGTGTTNLSTVLAPGAVTIVSDTGVDAVLLETDGVDAGVMSSADKLKLDGLVSGAAGDQTDAEIETAYNNQVPLVSQAEAEAGTSTTALRWSPERVKQAIITFATNFTNLTRTLSPTNVVIHSDSGADTTLPLVDGVNAGFVTPGSKTKLDGIEANATADQTDADIEAAYNAEVPIITQIEAEAGTSTTVLRITPERVKQAIDALGTIVTNLSRTLSPTDLIIHSDTGTDATLTAVDVTNAGLIVPGSKTKLDGIEAGATADQSNSEIEGAYNAQVPIITQIEAEAGTSTTVLRITPERVKQAITALAPGSSDTNLTMTRNGTSVQINSDTGDDVDIPTASTTEAGVYFPGHVIKLGTMEDLATADQTDAEIETAYHTEVPLVSQADAEAGVSTTITSWSPQRIKQAVYSIIGPPPAPEDMAFSSGFLSGTTILQVMFQEDGADTTILNSSGGLEMAPVYFPKDGTIDAIQMTVKVADTGKSIRMGLYNNSTAAGGSKPTTLIFETASLSLGTVGDIGESGLATAITAGWYWTAFVSDATGTCKMRATDGANNVNARWLGARSGNGSVTHLLHRTYAFGALPADQTGETWISRQEAARPTFLMSY